MTRCQVICFRLFFLRNSDQYYVTNFVCTRLLVRKHMKYAHVYYEYTNVKTDVARDVRCCAHSRDGEIDRFDCLVMMMMMTMMSDDDDLLFVMILNSLLLFCHNNRLAAIGVAERVAAERDSKVGRDRRRVVWQSAQ
jgi:hypothetical protein